ncbi:MAG: hypothetical protein IPK76_10040 [Lewinellaceae bacterium]|nr:hypothetical protein [Lewinellaceae bacterium]
MLEPAGFDCTPANQVRAWRVLDSIGQEAALRDPAQLKLRLAPLFARSAEGQKLFYEVFDKYVDTLDREHEPPKKLRRWPGLWKKSARIALACLAVAALAWLDMALFSGQCRSNRTGL